MKHLQKFSMTAITIIVTAASITSFAESYRALYIWASGHDLPGVWAALWPLQVDVFIATGELALFVALARAWDFRSRLAAWLVTLTGLAVSLAGNVGHVTGNLVTDRVTAAVPPVAAAASLAVALGILKRVVQRPEVTMTAPAVTPVSLNGHSDRLASLPSGARRVLYASEVIGTRNPRELTDWLAAQGFAVSPENARTAIRRALPAGEGSPNVQA
jgi:Protein of unknown function (DUF2637)